MNVPIASAVMSLFHDLTVGVINLRKGGGDIANISPWSR